MFHIRYNMRGEDNDTVFSELRDQVAEMHTLFWIKAGSRFVQNQDLRIVENGLCNP